MKKKEGLGEQAFDYFVLPIVLIFVGILYGIRNLFRKVNI